MLFETTILFIYRFIALAVAAMMVCNMVRNKDWQQQVFSVMIFIPFILRAVGVK